MASMVSVAAAADFNIVQKLYMFPIGIYQSIFNPLWSSYASAAAKNDWVWIKKTVTRSLIFTTLFFFGTMVLLTLFGKEAITLLAGTKYAVSYQMILLVGGYLFFYLLWACVITFQNSFNKITFINVTILGMAIITLPLCHYFINLYNIYGGIIVLLCIWCVLFIMHAAHAFHIIEMNMNRVLRH